MRTHSTLRQAGTIRTIDGREHRVLTFSVIPSLPQARDRDAHPVGGLVTGHARAPICAERLEERMAFGMDCAGLVHDADAPVGIVEFFLPRKDATLSGAPPDMIRAVGSSALGAHSDG